MTFRRHLELWLHAYLISENKFEKQSIGRKIKGRWIKMQPNLVKQ